MRCNFSKRFVFSLIIINVINEIKTYDFYTVNNFDIPRTHLFNFKVIVKSPVEVMVENTNQFGFRMLNYHSVFNVNNVAFSPCGLGSVMIALFEGSDGRCAYQIYKAFNLPRDRDIIRIGYRDIHRRLRVSLFF